MNYLFPYGTLQNKPVQIATYGRELSGEKDELLGYQMGKVRISDAEVVRKSGLAEHPVAIPTGRDDHEISGAVCELTDEKLAASDDYEVIEYERVSTVLKSGRTCWVYVLRADLLQQ